MEISVKELWTVLHGMLFGAVFLLAFAGAVAGLYSYSPQWTRTEGLIERARRLKIGLWTMSAVSWITVISGTWLVYIWYRAKPLPGADLTAFPRYFLLSKPETQAWHTFGMEWKEHVAWIVPFVTTSVAYTVHVYSERLANNRSLRVALIALLAISFFSAAVPGVFGAFINKIAATR
jgi:hypothetical protein